MVYNGKSQIEMDDLGVPPFQETSIYGYSKREDSILYMDNH
jgi:hypothetical protein